MAKNILQLLVCHIRYICKETESCNIYKIIFIKHTHITWKCLSVHSHIGRLQHIFRYFQRLCKVIGTACRNISDRNDTVTLHHTGYHLIQRTVSATAHNQIIFICCLCYFPDSICFCLCRVNCHFISTFNESIHNCHQLISNLTLSGFWIKDK